jgi:hypothetical protein
MRQWATRKKCKLDNYLLTVEPRAVDPHCFDADPDPAQNLDADPDPDPDTGGGGGGKSAKNVHPPWQNPRYAPDWQYCKVCFRDYINDDALCFQI